MFLRRFTGLFLLLFLCHVLVGQKNDYVWLQGYGTGMGYDTIDHIHWGITRLNFNDDPRSVRLDSFVTMNFLDANTSYCNDSGELQFYSNSLYIANSLNETIENSEQMDSGYYTVFEPNILDIGYESPQGLITIPVPGQMGKYYLFHTFIDSLQGGSFYSKKLLYTELDMNANAGHGRVGSKNVPVITDNLGSEVMAVRHGNGRDWWILIQKRNTNCFYRVLVTEAGIEVQPDLTCIGFPIMYRTATSANFSLDGSKFAYVDGVWGATIYDFDRCSGQLSAPSLAPLSIMADTPVYMNGVAFSPNNKYVYVGVVLHVYQIELGQQNIIASLDTVAVYDGFKGPLASYFRTMQNGPDGKIYESTGNGEYDYHVIQEPDKKGDSCQFDQHGLILSSFCITVPTFPNYRLGRLVGSTCDTISTAIDEVKAQREKILNIYPNPTTDIVTIDYGFTDWTKGEIQLQISNELGQTVYNAPVPMYSGFQKINVSSFAAGMYTARIMRQNSVVAVSKFVKQ